MVITIMLSVTLYKVKKCNDIWIWQCLLESSVFESFSITRSHNRNKIKYNWITAVIPWDDTFTFMEAIKVIKSNSMK